MPATNEQIVTQLNTEIGDQEWAMGARYGDNVVTKPIHDKADADRLAAEIKRKLGDDSDARALQSPSGYYRVFVDKQFIKNAVTAENRQREENSPKSDTLLRVRQIDWETAKKYFRDNPDKTKLSRKTDPDDLNRDTSLDVSFLCVNGVVYAKKTGDCLGEGNFGKVKIVENESGDNFAVKVEGRGVRGIEDTETRIMTMLGELQGEADRVYGKTFKGRYADKKLYTVMNLKKGTELYDHLYTAKDRVGKKAVSDEMKWTMAIKAAEAIKVLHDKNILHCDIKPENFMANRAGNEITIASIDFGFSAILAADQTEIRGTGRGSPRFCAPEICDISAGWANWASTAIYSKASDIYSLGKMFEYDMDLDISGTNLLAHSPGDRPTMTQLLDILYQKLASQPSLNPESQALIDSYKTSKKEKANTVSEYLGVDKGEIKTYDSRPGKTYVVFNNSLDLQIAHNAIIAEFGDTASRIAGQPNTIEIVDKAALEAIQENKQEILGKASPEEDLENEGRVRPPERPTFGRAMAILAEASNTATSERKIEAKKAEQKDELTESKKSRINQSKGG